MIGCICCHGATDQDGDCYFCDADKIKMKYEQGGDAACPSSIPTMGSNAAPTFNPEGCGTVTYEQAKLQTENAKKQNEARQIPGTVAWLIEELKKWPADTKVFVDWDYEGGNENQVDRIDPYDQYGEKGIKIS